MREIDVEHLGRSRVICCHEIDGYIVDPGPESSVGTLLEKLGEDWVPKAILLTHIHFDHAGATGRLVERWPDVPVWVHEIGAPHMINPERLVNSALRLYGDDFARLWGEVVPVPERNVRVLSGGESIEGFRVEYTPGHAKHHVAYFHEDTGTAYCGDVAGVKIGGGPVIPPTPPPDIDLEAWNASVDILAAWKPERLAITHFGIVAEDVPAHLAVLQEALFLWGELARHVDGETYAAAVRRRYAAAGDPEAADQAAPADTLWPGLNRYWTKKLEGA